VSFSAVKATTGTLDSVSVGIHATRTLTSTALDITDTKPLAPGYPPFSLASAGGVKLDLTLDAGFVLNYDSAAGGAGWLSRSGASPSLQVGASASIPTPAAVTGGLGILGISLGAGTTFSLSAQISTTWADPNNDGKLAFDEPGGAADDGELAAAGAAAGLVNPTLAAGSVNASLVIAGGASTAIALPAASATVALTAADLTVAGPQLSFDPGAFAPVQGFLALSARDLAQGLAQAASAVLGLQDATGAKLPFMRGDLADAIPAVEAIGKFLANHVPEPAPGSDTPGLPDFPSLQNLLEKLRAEGGLPGGADIDVLGAAYDAAKKKVSFTLAVSRTAGPPVTLDPAGAAISGTADYTDNTLVDASKNFSPTPAGAAALVGRQVVAGAASAVIHSASGNTLTLDPAPLTDAGNPAPTLLWKGGRPANGTAYSIAAADPKTGLVEFGDALKATGGVRSATGTVAQATVAPSYSLSVPIVLDLRDPDTGDCNPDPAATAACPFQQNDPASGISRIIDALPLPADRIMIRTGNTPLLSADAPISTSVDVNATVGFVGVRVAGTLKVCTTSAPADCTGPPAPADHLLTLSLKPLAGADADGDIPFTGFVDALRTAVGAGTPTDVVSFTVKGQAHAALTVSVPGAEQFFGAGQGSAAVTVRLPDLTNPGGLQVTAPDLGKLASLDVDPDNPMALFGAVLAALQAVQGGVAAIPGGATALDSQIPLLGRSFSQLIGGGVTGGGSGSGVAYTNPAGLAGTVLTDDNRSFNPSFVGRRVTIGTTQYEVLAGAGHTLTLTPQISPLPPAGAAYSVQGELQGLVNLLNNQPSANLQTLLDLLAKQLGGGSTATFAVAGGSPNVLTLRIDWKRGYRSQSPFNMSFGLNGKDRSIIGAGGTGLLDLAASGEVKLTVRIPLTAAAVQNPLDNLTVDPTDSFIRAGVTLNGDGTAFAVNLGPFQASLGDPNQTPSNTQLRAALGVRLANSGSAPLTLAAFFGGLDVAVNGDGDGDGSDDNTSCGGVPAGPTPLAVCANFPGYLNGTALAGAFTVRLPVGADLADTLNLAGAPIDGHPRLEVPTDLADALANAALNLFSFGDGFLGYLQFLENALHVASFDGKLPVVGKDLQAGSDFLGKLRADLQSIFGNSPPTDPTAGQIVDFFNNELKPKLPGAQHFTINVLCGAVQCAPDASGAAITGLTVSVDIGDDALPVDLPLDLGIPGLSIKATGDTDGVTGSIGWKLHLKFGFDRDAGFVVYTQDDQGGNKATPEFVVSADLDVPDTAAQLAFINIDETSNTPTHEFVGAFSIDLRADGSTQCVPDCTPDEQATITLADLTGGSIATFVNPVLNAEANIDWALRASVTAALPGIGADFKLHWRWASNAKPSDATGLDVLEFDNVTIDPGKFLGDPNSPIGKVVKQLVDLFKPVQPILDTIQAPLPVLSDLSRAVGGDDVTIASLAQAFSTLVGGPDIAPFLTVLKNIRDLVKLLSADCPSGTSFCVNVGSFKLVKDKALDTDANPATAQSLIAPQGTALAGPDPLAQLASHVNDVQGQQLLASSGGPDGPTGEKHEGLTFPALHEPQQLFGLLLGQDVELAHFDSGPLTLGFEFQQSFGPVYAPPPVNVVIGGGASVSLRVVAGFDTFGIRTAVEAKKLTPQILDSLYFVTADPAGKPIPVVHFEGFLQAGASVSVVIVEVGIVGGIKLTVDFTWNDPNNDGKFRFSEFLATALSNPICLFNVGGELSLFIKVFVTLGISPFSVSFDFTLVSIKLLDFSLKPDCTPPPPKLGGTSGDTLYLFAGKFGGPAERGHAAWDNNNSADETWIVRQVPADPKTGEPAKVVVQALGITEEFTDGGISTVVLDGRGYTGSLQVMFNGGAKGQQFSKKVVVATGRGNDVVRTGSGPSFVDGGAGNDQVTTFDRQDLSTALPQPAAVVAGGPGADNITVGNAVDTVLGDNALALSDQASVTTTAADGSTHVDLANVVNPGTVGLPADLAAEDDTGDGVSDSDGADTISVGLGGSTVYGNARADTIGTANDSPLANLPANAATKSLYQANPTTIVGGRGSDRIKSGSAADTVYTGAKSEIDSDGFGSGDDPADENSVDTGTGDDTVYGSNAKDFVTTHSVRTDTVTQHATAFGGDGNDVLIGGAGTDALYGGPADDYLVAEASTVSGDFPVTDVLGAARAVTRLPSTAPASAKTLVGGGGKDRIYGGDGPASIFGDHQVDPCVRQADPVSKQPPQHPTTTGPASGQDNDDLILGGSGVDIVQAGGGNDHAFLGGGTDVACGNAGADELFGGGQEDLVYGGSEPDTLYGDANDDELYGNTGADTGYGGAGNDLIEGNDGADTLFGGADTDLVIGGTSKAGEPDTGDRLYGDTGTDTLLGDNAFVGTGPVGTPVDLELTAAAPAEGGADTIFGGDQDDVGYGGLRNDTMFGGAGSDRLEGNNAVDTIFGETGADNLIGGSSQEPSAGVGRPDAGDVISGGDQDDVITGDNARLGNVAAGTGSDLTKGRGLTSERSVVLLDLGLGAATGLFGADTITGGNGPDVILGQRGTDRIFGDGASDYAEGGPDADWVEGGPGSDDLVGGSSSILAGSGAGDNAAGQLDTADVLFGQDGDDVAAGDNAIITRVAPFSDLTNRIGSTGQLTERRALRLLDLSPGGSVLSTPPADRFGADQLSGQAGVDLLLGQDGPDQLAGGSGDDYAEGQGANDTVYGDRSLAAAGVGLPVVAWPGSPSAGYDADTGADGQDDLIGGSSRAGFRDTADIVHGDGVSDFILGDNGSAARDVLTDPNDGHLSDRVYTLRYPPAVPAGAAKVRHSAAPFGSTRFCSTAQPTCEPAGAFGNDALFGEAGDDFGYGQDGNDTVFGGTGDDDLYGELGDDALFGEAGEDAILGDRGGIRDVYENGSASSTVSVTQPPALTYTSRRAGSVSRVADLLHDVQGDAFVGAGAGGPMPYNGVAFGGNDRIRGGPGHDGLHAGVGDDLVNGDSGGDTVFGDDGADVLWGGKGCDQTLDTPASAPDCYPGGVFDPAARGTNDRFVDYLFGGKGATSGPSVGPNGDLGSDVTDWRPRGSFAPGTGCTTNPWPQTLGAATIDPCAWFELTDITDIDDTNNQHHQGIDWQYDGWDRDVLQADVADNGPNAGDRLLDWSGSYNLYTHCNAANGGFNDVRQFSPAMQDFLQRWAYGVGAGQTLNDALTAGTSAFVELALVYMSDNNAHGTGPAFPGTPGHFDTPNACAP
jgi:Ca2+-binding RTX toxin-like protein